MPLFSERKRLKALAVAEASGQSFWSEDIPVEARTKIAHLFAVCSGLVDDYNFDLYFVVTRRVSVDLGVILRTIDFNSLWQTEETNLFLILWKRVT